MFGVCVWPSRWQAAITNASPLGTTWGEAGKCAAHVSCCSVVSL